MGRLLGLQPVRDLLKLLGFLHAAVRHINTVMCKKCSTVCVYVRVWWEWVVGSGWWGENNMASLLPQSWCSCSCGPRGAHCHADKVYAERDPEKGLKKNK